LVAGYTCAVLPWFLDYYAFYQQHTKGIEFGAAIKLFHRCYPVGVPIGLCVIGYGVQLLRCAERRAEHVAWYVVLSLSLAAFWFVWTLIVERSFYGLLFPA